MPCRYGAKYKRGDRMSEKTNLIEQAEKKICPTTRNNCTEHCVGFRFINLGTGPRVDCDIFDLIIVGGMKE